MDKYVTKSGVYLGNMDGIDEGVVNEVQLGTFDDSDEGIELHNMNASD